MLWIGKVLELSRNFAFNFKTDRQHIGKPWAPPGLISWQKMAQIT
jgi:hypothetical protein